MEPFWPLTVFAYCPKCGANRGGARSVKHYVCEACGFQYFQNAATAVIAIIRDDDGRVLFVRRENDPGKGKLDLPGGFVDPLECAEAALVREVREETGLSVSEATFETSFVNRYDYEGVTYYSCDLVFDCSVADPAGAAALDETSEVLFLHPGEVPPEDIGLQSTRDMARWLSMLNPELWQCDSHRT